MKTKDNKDNSKVGFLEKIGFTCYSTSANIVYNFKSLYYLIFLTNVLQIPVLTAGIMMTLGTVWDVINDPIIGVMAENIKFKSSEKVRPYIKWVAIPFALSFVLLFTDFNVSTPVAVALSLLIFFFYEIANTFRGIPYNAMGNLASGDDKERKSINAYRSLGGCIGSGLGAVAVTPIVRLFGGLQESDSIIGKSDGPALFKTALFMGCLIILGCLIHYFTTRERVKAIEESDEKLKFVDAYKKLFKCNSWVKNMFYIMCYGVCNTLVMTSINYYAAYVLGSSAAATPILAAYLVTAVVFSLLTPSIDTALGRKKTMYLGVIIQIVGKIPFLINPYSTVCVYINAVSIGIGQTMTFVMFNTNRNNISDIVELQNHRRMDTMVSTGDNLASKIAEALVTQGMTIALSIAGFDEALLANQTSATINVICSFLGWVPLVVLIIMLFIVSRMNISGELEEAKAARALEG